MSMNNQGRPTDPNRRTAKAPGTIEPEELATISGDRGLDHEEKLIFELDHGAVGVDLPDVQIAGDHLGGQRRKGAIGLPGLSEPEVIRHFVRLSRKNYAIDSGLYPLGSCTMKHNPRLNEKMARLPGLRRPAPPGAAIHHARRPGTDFPADELAHHADRHAGRGHVAQGRRAWRVVRLARHPRRHPGARRKPHPRAGAGIRPWHQSRHRRLCRVHGGFRARQGQRPCRCRRPEGQARPRRGGDHADQSQHLRAVRRRGAGDRRCRARGRRLFLLRRRQLQRHRRPGASGRPGRRCHAHQPAQDLLARRMAAAVPVRGPVVLSERLAPFAPLPLLVADGKRPAPDRTSPTKRPPAPSRSAACAPSTARWACSAAP